MMYWGEGGMNGWGYALMSVTTLAFWLLLIVGVVLVVRDRGGWAGPPPSRSPSTAEQILAERFARGEIDDEEYRRRLATVRGQADPRST